MMSLVSKGAPDKFSGAVMGSFQSSASLARVIGPVIAGFLYDRGQPLPFLLAGALMIVVFVLSLKVTSEAENYQLSPKEAELSAS
jgi:MFS family permease